MWTPLHNWVWDRSLWESSNDGQEESRYPGDSKRDPKQKSFKAPFNFCVVNKTALAVHGQSIGCMYLYEYVWASLFVVHEKCVCVSVYTYVSLYISVHVCCAWVCMPAYGVCVYIYAFMCLYICGYVCASLYLSICTRFVGCMHVCLCMHVVWACFV